MRLAGPSETSFKRPAIDIFDSCSIVVLRKTETTFINLTNVITYDYLVERKPGDIPFSRMKSRNQNMI